MLENFKKDVEVLKKSLEKGIELSDVLLKTENADETIKNAVELAFESEKIVNQARLLPHVSGIKKHRDLVEDNFIEYLKIKITKTKRGWYIIDIPALLPRKEKGSASYIRASVFTALERHFKYNLDPKLKGSTVLCFNHIYSKERSWRHMRDHDNIEVNVVVDAVALFLLEDDGPAYCDHYYEGSIGDEDRTIITLLPKEDFVLYLQER